MGHSGSGGAGRGGFRALGRFTVRRRKAILVLAVALFAGATVLGAGTVGRLGDVGFDSPDSESSRASEIIRREFDTRDPNFVLLVTARRGDVDDPAVAGEGRALTEQLADEPGLSEVVSYWSLSGVAPLRSKDGTQALVLGIVGGEHGDRRARVADLSAAYTRPDGDVITVAVTGWAEIGRQLNRQVEADLLRAEAIAFPITLVLLALVFGSLVAAGLPLAVGAFAIVGSLALLGLIAAVTEVSIYALNLTTMSGLGLAIDYSLFTVSRFREELHRGRTPHEAVEVTVETAGRTVAFSALTVAVSLAALFAFPLGFLRSFAYAGISVSILAAAGATVFLPALLAVLGHRVDRLALWKRRPAPEGTGLWHRVATFVMRRPIPVAATVTAGLLVLGVPFLDIEFGLPDDRTLPTDMSSRAAADEIRRSFGSRETDTLQVVLPDVDAEARHEEVEEYARALSRIENVARVDALTGTYLDGAAVHPDDLPADTARAFEETAERFRGDGSTWLAVVPAVEQLSDEGERLARAVREVDAPFETLVSGSAAELIDTKTDLFRRLPVAAVLLATATFVLLFLMFGGLLVPLKALVINTLSLSASLGAIVYVFQQGHFSDVLDFTATGTIPAMMPILVFCVAFGLSMDYEVFLLSRIKEEYDRSGDNTASVAAGLERTGRIVTAAAVLISVVFMAFATSGVTFVKMFGLGLSLAVLMDAFVIRGTLVPAFMRLAGRANWWAPARLRRLQQRVHLDHD